MLVFILASSQLALADNAEESHDHLETLAVDFVSSLFSNDNLHRDVTAQPLDPRSRYAKCDTVIETELPGKQRLTRNVTVQLRCQGSQPWVIYLPVRIREMQPVVVAKASLSAGTVLSERQIKLVYRESILTRGGAVTDIESVVGAKLKRQVRVNDPILLQQLCVVCKGETVTIVVEADGFRVKADGIALSDASLGERVRIKNSRSGQTFEAQVSAVGVVTVTI
jgi:flagella basal body P-ring formation protein FlgA